MSNELVVLSHLRWVFVWQRPQHLIARVGRHHDRTWFVEQPVIADVAEPTLRCEQHGTVDRVWLELPDGPVDPTFDARASDTSASLLPSLLGETSERTVWIDTPMALDLARALDPSVTSPPKTLRRAGAWCFPSGVEREH